MPKPVLSHKQFAAVLFVYVVGSSLLYIPEINYAGKDAWISTLLGACVGLVVLAAWLRLARRHPGKSPVQICIKIMGPVIGYPLGFYLVLLLFIVATLILQNVVYLNSIIVLRNTPLIVIRLTFTATAIYACYKGVESIGRISELGFLPLTLMVVVLPILDFPKISFQALQPLFSINIPGVLVGLVNTLVFPFAESLGPLMLIPYVSRDREAEKYYFLVLAAAGMLLLLRTLIALTVLSAPIAQMYTIPFFSLLRHVSLGEFFDRAEGLFLGIFLFGLLLKLIITVYAVALGTAQLFGVKRLQNIWLPLGALIIMFSCTMYPTFGDFFHFGFMVFPVLAFPGEVLFPLVLAAMDGIKGRLHPGTVDKLDGKPQQPGEDAG